MTKSQFIICVLLCSLLSCGVEESPVTQYEEVEESNSQIFQLKLDSAEYNKILSEYIDIALLEPGKTDLAAVKQQLGTLSDSIQGVIDGYDFALYPTEYKYDSLNLSIFSTYSSDYSGQQIIDAVEFSINSGISLKVGLSPGTNSKMDIIKICGPDYISDGMDYLIYPGLGVSFKLTELDTIESIMIN